jgi:hypothetical protein
MSSLTVFKQDGIELVIDTMTGEAFATQAGYCRMSGVAKDTISKRMSRGYKGVDITGFKMAEIFTGGGLQGVALIPADTVFDWLLKDNPGLAKAMGKAGATVYMHQLAGYKLTTTAIAPSTPQTYIEALKALIVVEEEKERLRLENADLIEEVEQLTEVVDELFDYSSIIRIAKYNGTNESIYSWRSLKVASKIREREVKKVPCPRYGTKNLYSHDAWRLAYPGTKLPDTTTLVIVKN